jgi:hypothetical protein
VTIVARTLAIMSRGQAALLRTFSVWTIYVWITRIFNILRDDDPEHGAAFKAVHSVLAIISVGLAIAALVVVQRIRRRPGATTNPGT